MHLSSMLTKEYEIRSSHLKQKVEYKSVLTELQFQIKCHYYHSIYCVILNVVISSQSNYSFSFFYFYFASNTRLLDQHSLLLQNLIAHAHTDMHARFDHVYIEVGTLIRKMNGV